MTDKVQPWRGIFTIPQTPFDEQGELDEESLRREVDFCIRAGAHGLVAPVVASEFYVLSDDERRRMTHILVDEARGRLPTIIGVTAPSREQAVAFSREAQEAGADGVIAMPPHVLKASRDGVYAYFKAISDAISLPIFIQNAPPPLGSALPPAFMVQMCREFENVQYIKEETLPTGHSITAILRQAGPEVRGVFGGAAARWMLPELERGAAGFMPACQFTDIYVQIWDLWEAGDRERARTLFNTLLPLINLEGMLSVSLVKEVLVRRGVIASPHVRRPDGAALDEYDICEMERCLEDVAPYFTVTA
ncbi:MAG: dihydrodipicolinate synthase family protein [Ardenticatenaceae bacterium]|nr:dihydrodipicolinate synthase family protein [Ardenticatenaceae bacterium]